MEMPDEICGYDWHRVQTLFKAFDDLPSGHDFVDGEFVLNPKRMTADLAMQTLSIDQASAHALIAGLTAGGWLEPDRAVPSRRGMALLQHIERPRISRSEADDILAALIKWTEEVNLRGDVATRITSLHIYGSYLRDEPDVGDLDIVMSTNHPQLIDSGCFEEVHFVELDDLLTELAELFPYVSPADENEMDLMDDVEFRQVWNSDDRE